jgi:hypothetical protein
VRSEERNALEAISNGAVSTVNIVFAIIANLIVFLALLALLDNVVEWFVSLLGYDGWTFEVRARVSGRVVTNTEMSRLCILSGGAGDGREQCGRLGYGVQGDAGRFGAHIPSIHLLFPVAQLLGTKTVLNEFIAYKRLSTYLADGTLSVDAIVFHP